MQIMGNGPVHSAAFVHLAASCAQALTLKSALDAMIAANSIELLMVMISLPLMLSEKGKGPSWTAPPPAAAQPESFR